MSHAQRGHAPGQPVFRGSSQPGSFSYTPAWNPFPLSMSQTQSLSSKQIENYKSLEVPLLKLGFKRLTSPLHSLPLLLFHDSL